jgi:hypothetical protein
LPEGKLGRNGASPTLSAIFDHETDPELRKSLLRSWVDREIGPLETADALARLEDLPAEMFPEALKLTAGAVGNNRSFDTGMAGVVEFLEEMERRDLWRHIPEDQIESLVGSLGPSANRSAMDPGEVLEHLGSIAREDLRKIALTQTGREWARYSKPEMILQHVETLPSGSDRDVFLSGILEGMFDEEVFKVLRERIEDPEIREKAPKKAPREAY